MEAPRPVASGDQREQLVSTPPALRVLSDWTWRLLVVAGGVAVLSWGAAQLSFIVGPIIVATMICALLEPVRLRLLRMGATSGVAWSVAFGLGILCVSAVAALAVGQFYGNYELLARQSQEGVSEVAAWLESGPLKIDAGGLEETIDRGLASLEDDPSSALSGTFSVLSTTTELIAGALLTFLCTLFFMKDRQMMWANAVSLLPGPGRQRFDLAGKAAWQQLIGYVKVTLTSAVVDSVFIGGACIIAGLPVAFALGGLVFLFAFIPTVGAIISGAVVVLVALVSQGTTTALILAGVVILVQQLDANVMYPYLANRHLSFHPLASLLLVAAGGVVGGLFGAFIAVPAAAMGIAAVRVLGGESPTWPDPDVPGSDLPGSDRADTGPPTPRTTSEDSDADL